MKMYKQLAEKITKFVINALKKEDLFEMARNGEARPNLSRVLSNYTGSSYDPEIKKIAPPHWFPVSRPLDSVVNKMLDAHKSPAHKANAAKALKNYSQTRAVEIGSTPKRVAAGVKAAVTKRRQKAGDKKCSTN